MKRESLLFHYNKFAAQTLLLSFAFLLCGSASAQLLKNGDFEQPLGPTNWTVLYLHGGPDDFQIKDRCRDGSRSGAWFGGYFRPITQKVAHACFTQTVTNLTPDHVYNFSGYMTEGWWKAPDDALRNQFLVYIEVIGGQGNPLADGRFSVLAVATDTSNLDAPYTYPNNTWLQFTTQQTPDANRKIEVRLHYNKINFCIYDKTYIMQGAYDDISLTP